jgi:hypothetical protein
MIDTPLAQSSRVDLCAVSAEFPRMKPFLRFAIEPFVLKRRDA